jgi:hypothetical protein
MANKPESKPGPAMTPQAEAEREARLEREASALRENLRRRKDQLRARAKPAGEALVEAVTDTDSAGGGLSGIVWPGVVPKTKP